MSAAACARVPRVVPPAPAPLTEERRARLRACTILLVDDEPANLDLLETLLEGAGYASLVRTGDSREVAALYARHRPDLVMLDLHMPYRHGLEVLAELRALTPDDEYRPVLVLTADATWQARERALAHGARDFLTKPFQMAEVLLRVENLLTARVLHADERAARERAEAAEARATLLAEWSRLLAASLDPTSALARLPELLVPRWARGCATVVRVGGAVRPLSGAVSDGVADGGAVLADLRARAATALRDAGLDADVAPIAPAGTFSAPVETGEGPVAAVAISGAAAGGRALIEELTSRAALAAEHARLLAAAELATRERERLLAVVAHDLRNPLGAVAMYAEMLASLQPDEGGDPYVRGALATIHGSAATMQRLVEDLLDASTLRGDALRVRRVPQRAGAPFDEAERMLRPLAEARGLAFTVAADGDAAAREVALDGPRLVQLLSNVVGNAVRFTPAGGAVAVRYGIDDGALVAAVRDTGPGIAEDDLPHLFTAFWRRDRREPGGAGLGLWIARAIAEAHGGTLRVSSRPGAGTTFHLTIPLATPPARRWED